MLCVMLCIVSRHVMRHVMLRFTFFCIVMHCHFRVCYVSCFVMFHVMLLNFHLYGLNENVSLEYVFRNTFWNIFRKFSSL